MQIATSLDSRISFVINAVFDIRFDLTRTFFYVKGGDNAGEAAKFIQRRFEALNRCPSKRVHTFVMSVQSDTDAVRHLVETVIQYTSKQKSKSS